MKPLLLSILVLLTLSLATPAALAQSGGGANIGGAANTAEGTGRGAGGPGDGQGPGQGAGQGLGPGGRDKKAEREQAEKEKKERAQREKEAREKKDQEKREREQAEREKKQREKEEREAKEKADNEKKEAEQKEREQREREEKEKADNEKKQREKEEREAKEKADNEKKEAEQKEREQREREEKEKADNEKKQRETEENRPPEEPAKPEPPAGEPTKPEDKPSPPAAPAKTDDTPPAGPSGPTADPEPRRPLPPGRDSPVTPIEQTRLDIPSVPSRGDLPSAPSVPTSPGSLVPSGRVDEVLGTSPSSAVDRFFGIFTGGSKRAAAPAVATTVTTGKGVVTLERPASARRARGAFLGIFRPEFPNLPAATKIHKVAVDTRVTSPRTVTYKSRLSRVSRWIGPLTLGLLNYVPFETMNAAVAGRINNLMAEEEISVEQLVARIFQEGVRDGKRYVLANNPQAVFELEMTRYALDPMPTSLGRVKPTVSVTGRLYDNNGQLLWIGKGFSTIAEPGLKGANVEHYEANPAQLRADFETATRVAMSRLVAQANAVPKASVKVTAAD
jgi:hypothetical protein